MVMYNPPHPGEVIADVLGDLSLSHRGLAKALGVAPSTVARLIAGQSVLTAEMAVKLAYALGSTPDMWLRLQSQYSLNKARVETDLSGVRRVCVADDSGVVIG